jgi:4-hydroxy-2-oxoheptanedioate aldolase
MTSASSAYAALSQRLGKGTGSGLLTGWIGIPDPLVASVIAREDFDAVTLDMQHGFVDVSSAVNGIAQIALAGKPAIIRIPVGEFATASRMLDAGASGIIAPMVNTVEDARLLAAYTKYPPRGERSWGPAVALNISGVAMTDYLARANGLTVTIAMVETREAMAALDEILGVDGIDGVLVGPSDLSITLSNGANVNASRQDVTDALEHVARRCKAHGKAACTFAPSGERARDLIKVGYDLLAIGTDIMQIRAGCQAAIKEARRP